MSDNYELSRRKALLGLGTIGAAGAGAGLGTSAFFSDEETFSNNKLVAGTLDMQIAATHHYVDWLPDTDTKVDTDNNSNDDLDNDSPQETDDASMSDTPNLVLKVEGEPNIELEVSDGDAFAAGSVENIINGGAGTTLSCDPLGDANVDPNDPALIDLGDVKPGDFGLARFCFRLCDNPGYVWANSSLVEELTDEGKVTEPEAKDADEDQNEDGSLKDPPGEKTVELLDVVRVAWLPFDVAGRLTSDRDLNISESMTLRQYLNKEEMLLGQDEGDAGTIPADQGGGVGGRCYNGDTRACATLVWWVPPNGYNEIQDDRAGFDIKFRTEQCRHNDQRTGIPTSTGEGFAKVAENFNGDESKSGGARARFGNNGPAGAWELAVGDAPGDGGEFQSGGYEWTSGAEVNWTLDYTASSNELEFTFDNNTITATLDNPQPDGRIALQGKADEATAEASVDDLTIDGSSQSLSGPTSASISNDGSDRAVGYLLIDTSLDGSTDFELSGTASVSLQSDYSGSAEDVAIDIVLE